MSDERERLQTACDEALHETYLADQAIVHARKMAAAALLEERDAKATYAKKLAAFGHARKALREYDEKHTQEGGR